MMRLEWIDDILAVLNAGSLNEAAGQRHLTQPAFSRRIKKIEDYVGVQLLDRSYKPVQPHKVISDHQQKLEELASGLRDLLFELRQRGQAERKVVIASQHAITTSIAPDLIKLLSDEAELRICLRSANRDECFTLLATKKADLTITYRCVGEQLPLHGILLEELDLQQEMLVPIYPTDAIDQLKSELHHGRLPVVIYPSDVFLGEILNRDIIPQLQERFALRARAETALTLAALQLAKSGVGVAWVPRSLALHEIGNGQLSDLSASLGKIPLRISAMRLASPKSEAEKVVWAALPRENTSPVETANP